VPPSDLPADLGADRRARLSAAKLYLVCPPTSARTAPGAHELSELVTAAVSGGVDVVQLREKDLDDEELLTLARTVRALCERLGALFVVNDHPLVARECGADGIHVGQEDMPVAKVRALVGPDMLVGLSTHAPAEIDAVDASLVDYIGVGPVHATPTKLGRPAVGLELVRYAATHAPVPFFAIGGIDESNVAEVLGAGSSRVCVLRAVSDPEDPSSAARGLRDAIEE
jgi:thiamine-phosphate pyrophosphorylase